LKTILDKDAAVKYMAWDDDQWVSYDDEETLKMKVDYANKQGLLGLFVWAIDLDDVEHTALKALLGGELGKFAGRNGYDPLGGGDNWDSVTGNQCGWTPCGQEGCGAGWVDIGAEQYCGLDSSKNAKKQTLCCPIKAAPAKCSWSAHQGIWWSCSSACEADEISIASSTEPYIEGDHMSCSSGFASYCCESTQDTNKLCSWTEQCVDTKDESVCGDHDFVTTRQAECKFPAGYAFCCDKGTDTSSCYWNEGKASLAISACDGARNCAEGLSRYGSDTQGGKDKYGSSHECQYELWTDNPMGTWEYADLAFCCDSKQMGKETINMPVPLSDLFPSDMGEIPESNAEKLDIKVDRTMGGQQAAGNDDSPDKNAFGFYIVTGPENEMTSVDKRDGSHWELFDCDNAVGEQRQTVKAVCTDSSENSNCNIIFKGGVPRTVVDMPAHCGPGKYSVAVSLRESTNHTHLHHRLEKRGLRHAPVYDFTFDYDFLPIEKRADSKVLVRIDYSDDPGYWSTIVSAHHDSKKRDLEVETHFGGSHHAWLEHTWRKEKRLMNHEELHKRWWSGNVKEWADKQKAVDVDYTGIRHRVYDTFTVKLFDQDLKCPKFPEWIDELYFRSWVDLTVDIETAAGVTVIGRLGDLKSFEESSAWFHTSGSIDASLNFEAKGKMSFHTGQVELFGAHNFGASFRVPGIVTIGPDFRVLGSLSGDASLHLTSSYTVNFAKWDYSMRYPVPSGQTDAPEKMGDYEEPKVDKSQEPFEWDLDASGQLTAHIIPKVTFGIVFDSSAISNAAMDLGVDAYTRLYADLKAGQDTSLVYCYGMDGGATLFANIEAPKLFNTELSRYYPLFPYTFDILPRKCSDGST
jgi:chitinase